MNISRDDATTWATWFRALGDPTRVLILNLLASAARPMTVGEIVEQVDVGQSTVSHHLKILGDVRFVLVDRVSTTSWWRINESCLDCLPTATELVMGGVPTSDTSITVAHGCGAGLHSAIVQAARPVDVPESVVRPMTADDWPQMRAIYEAGIATGNATFETAAPTWERWDASHLADHRLVAEIDGAVTGWAALSPVSDRCVYGGVVENSIYVATTAQGRGVGRALLGALVESSEAAGIWTVQTGIFPENTASIALHERCGFRVIGRRERIGRLNGVWRDTLLLERRSANVGEWQRDLTRD